MAAADHSGHRERLKNRFLKQMSFEDFEDHNILEFLLFFTIPRKDTNELAHALIDRFGSLSAVFDASVEDICTVPGISKNSATLIKAVLPIARTYNRDKYDKTHIIDSTEKAVEFLLEQYLGYGEEVFSLVGLDNCSRLVCFEIISKGGVESVLIDNRNFSKILTSTGATQAIICHNHPSGVALPSGADAMVTRRLRRFCEVVGVRLIDHIIIAGNDGISMRESKEYKQLFE